MTPDADNMLTTAVQWLDDANNAIVHWEKVQNEAKEAAAGPSGTVGEEERKLWEDKADIWSRMTGIGLAASRQIQRAAAEELSRLQNEFFVEDVKVGAPSKATGKVIAEVKLKRAIPHNHQFWWKAGGADVRPRDAEWKSVEIDANELPFGDTTVEVLVGKLGKDPKDKINPWLHI
jgi:hypothetical protein